MEWNDEMHTQSCEEVDRFLYGTIDEQIDIVQENQWLKYDESCMHVKYSLLIKTIYDLVLIEGWTPDSLLKDCSHHIARAKELLAKRNNPELSKEDSNIMSENEFLDRLEKAKQKYLD